MKNKLLLIGWDAADWKLIGPLLAKGLMPNLKKVINSGVYGNMSTMNPPYSPMLWSSVATGKTPDKHGVLGFIEVTPDRKAVRPVTVNSRKSRALWNIFHNQGMKSNLVGWWPSFPAEPINGVIVTDKYQKVNRDPAKKSPLKEGTIHPQSLVKDLVDLRMFPWELTKEHILPFIPKAGKIDQTNPKNRLVDFSNVMSHAVSIQNAATYLLRETEWDFMGVYYDFIDHLCHGFMKFHPPKLDGIPDDKYEIYKDVVNSAYRFQDMMLGRKLELIDENTTVIIMSDHGFESGYKRILKMPKVNAAPALDHRQFGIFVAMGPNIKKNEKLFGLNLIDIAPTILHHFNLPIGKDMDGKVMMDIFEKTTTPKYIDSWEDVQGDFGQLKKETREESWSDQEVIDQLVELGYIDKPDEKIENSIIKTESDLKQNLARVYLGKKDFHKAKELLIELIQNVVESEKTDLVDIAPYYIDLMNVSLGLNEYDEVEKYLDIFKTIKTKVSFNTYFIESNLYYNRGEVEKAAKILEQARDKKPNAEIHYRLGRIYTSQTNYELAQESYEKAIAIEPYKAKYHQGMAEAYFYLEEYEEAADYAFTSIELVKYYPEAHFILGRSLEKLGDTENAKIALDTAAKLKPKNFELLKRAQENIEEKLALPFNSNDREKYIYRKDQVVVVSGLPRSGTSLMMQMLDKGGISILSDGKRKADISNPKGYYEYEPVMSMHKDNSWLSKAKNKGIKIVAPLLQYLSYDYRYKVIFMTRDLNEVIKSQQIMKGKDPETLPVKLLNSFSQLLKTIKHWDRGQPGVEILYVNYKELLNNPIAVTKQVNDFIGIDMDNEAMASCIDLKLYRNKSNVEA